MKPRNKFITASLPASRWTTANFWEFVLTFCTVTVLAMTCPGRGDSLGKEPEGNAGLP